jgi:AbrB family looped-hinge helix DNA binding protein
MTNRVGPKGQVVIPKPFRDELGIGPGDEVIFWLEGDDLHLKRVPQLETLRGLLAGSALREEFEAERRWELEKEERRAGPPRSSGTA